MSSEMFEVVTWKFMPKFNNGVWMNVKCWACAAGILMILLVSGCHQFTVSKEDDTAAQYYIGLLRAGDFGPIERDFDPAMPKLDATLIKMRAALPKGEPTSVKTVGYNVISSPNFYKSNTTYEYDFSGKYLLISVATQKSGETFTITGFHVNLLPDSLENIHKFSLVGKSPTQYAVLVLAVVIPLFVLYSLVVCIRTRIPKRKWLWILFILFGFGRLLMNWTTGRCSIDLISFQLFGASAFAQFYGPWVIAISFPLGAIVFLLRKKRLVAGGE